MDLGFTPTSHEVFARLDLFGFPSEWAPESIAHSPEKEVEKMRRRVFSRRSAKVLATAAMVIGAIGVASSARGQTELSFVVPTLQKSTVVYVREDVPRHGTRFVGRGPLLDESGTDRIGTGYFDCVVQQNVGVFFDHGLFVCDAVFKLADGEIMVTGLDPGGISESTIAVTGGTGAYSTARGDGTWTDTETETIVLIHLTT
jgi:hypothetical protein